MTINLSTYDQIACALVVRITVEEYKADGNDTFHKEILKFNDSQYPISLLNDNNEVETYVGLGNLVSISSTKSELRASSSDLTIGIAGIPETAISEISNSKFKGSKVEIYRVVVNAATGAPLDIPGNPIGRFFGIVSNYSFMETYENALSKNIINIICSSHIDTLQSRIKGRRTNPYDEAILFPNDKGFSRVPSLIDATYDFGGSTTTTTK